MPKRTIEERTPRGADRLQKRNQSIIIQANSVDDARRLYVKKSLFVRTNARGSTKIWDWYIGVKMCRKREAVRFFGQLETFNHRFPKPTFSVAVTMKDVPRIFTMGSEKQHAKLMLSNGPAVIHWNGADVFAGPESGEDERVFIITGTLGINEYNGDESLQLIATDIREYTKKNRRSLHKGPAIWYI